MFSPYAEFGTDHRRGTRHQRGRLQLADGFFDSFLRQNDEFFLQDCFCLLQIFIKTPIFNIC